MVGDPFAQPQFSAAATCEMAVKKCFSTAKTAEVSAALIGAVVEDTSVEDALQQYSLSKDSLIEEMVAPNSSEGTTTFMKERMEEYCGKDERKESDELYLVKKVYWPQNGYWRISDAISDEDTDKFNVLKLIGCDRGLIGYKERNPGIEAYLVYGSEPAEAMRNTIPQEPMVTYSHPTFDYNDAIQFDKVLTNALYTHTPEAVQRLFSISR